MAHYDHQGIIRLNDKKFLYIPEEEKLHIGYCFVDGIICNRKEYDDNIERIKTINIGLEKELITIFLDELDSPLK